MLKNLTAAGILIALTLSPALGDPSYAPIKGKVTRVLNGDTLQFSAGGRSIRIQLSGIDAPEEGQPMARESKVHLEQLVLFKDLTVQIKTRDMYKRFIAQVILPDRRIVNHEMVKAGYAWWYRKYAGKDKTLAGLEASAKAARRGIWAQPNPVPPWEFREFSEGRH